MTFEPYSSVVRQKKDTMTPYQTIIRLASNNIKSAAKRAIEKEEIPPVDLFTASEVLGVALCKDPQEIMSDLLREQGIIWNESTTPRQLTQMFFDF